jgi:SAM-dependent methyltransferase
MAEFCEDQWFDRTRRVHTSRNLSLDQAGLTAPEARDGHMYQPARPHHIRRALTELPVRDLSDFTYVDLGSGKGRTLFVAAEHPFRQIIGVEFSPMLHRDACENIRRYRDPRPGRIVSMHADAKDFVFPDTRLVVYLFNPFGPETMQRVLRNLAGSLDQRPRHVLVVLLWPRCEDMVAAMDGMRLIRRTPQYQIFEAYRPE